MLTNELRALNDGPDTVTTVDGFTYRRTLDTDPAADDDEPVYLWVGEHGHRLDPRTVLARIEQSLDFACVQSLWTLDTLTTPDGKTWERRPNRGGVYDSNRIGLWQWETRDAASYVDAQYLVRRYGRDAIAAAAEPDQATLF